MGISVVIPCLNEENYIADCIGSLVNNGFSNEMLEILVVDGGSSDKTRSILALLQKDFNNIRVIDNPQKKTPFALNLGVLNASNPFVLIAGAHAVYPKGYLQSLFILIQNPEIDVVGGAIETKVKSQNSKTSAIAFVLSHRFGVGNSQFRIGGHDLMQVDTVPFGLYKKEIFEKAGLYNEKLIRNHDIELSKRITALGYKIWLEPSLKVTYYARDTFNGLAKNNYGNGFWNLKTLFITNRFRSLSVRHYIPLLFILSILLPLMAIPFLIWAIIPALISIWAYLTVFIIIAIQNMGHQNPVYLIFAFVTLHFSYGWGSLMGLFSVFNFRHKR